MSGRDQVPILCTLARHHTGDHDELAVPGRKPCGALIRYYEPEPEKQVPTVEPVAVGAIVEHDVREPGEMTLPEAVAIVEAQIAHERGGASPPPLSTLIAEVVDRAESVEALTREAHAAEANRVRAVEAHARAMSAVAQRAHADKIPLVKVGDVLFRPKPPRKPRGGKAAEGALWGLEPVEVGT